MKVLIINRQLYLGNKYYPSCPTVSSCIEFDPSTFATDDDLTTWATTQTNTELTRLESLFPEFKDCFKLYTTVTDFTALP